MRGIADGAKFVARVPVRPGVAVGKLLAQEVERVDVVERSRQIPIGIELIRRLMVAMLRVVIAQYLAGRFATRQQVEAASRVERRNAHFGEADMVGAVEG